MSFYGILSAILALTFVPSLAAAQDKFPPVDVAAGYASLRNADIGERFPAAMFVSMEGNYRRWLAAVGEFSGTRANGSPRFFGDPHAGTGAFLAGPKVVYRGQSRLAPFAQLLVGVGSSGSTQDGGSPAVAIQPGAGVDIAVRRHIALRVAVDRRELAAVRSARGSASLAMMRAGLVLH